MQFLNYIFVTNYSKSNYTYYLPPNKLVKNACFAATAFWIAVASAVAIVCAAVSFAWAMVDKLVPVKNEPNTLKK